LRHWSWQLNDEHELRDSTGTLIARLESNAGRHRLTYPCTFPILSSVNLDEAKQRAEAVALSHLKLVVGTNIERPELARITAANTRAHPMGAPFSMSSLPVADAPPIAPPEPFDGDPLEIPAFLRRMPWASDTEPSVSGMWSCVLALKFIRMAEPAASGTRPLHRDGQANNGRIAMTVHDAAKLIGVSKDNGAPMSRWKPGRRRRTQIDGQFAARLIQMLESPPYRQLSLSARRVLDRLEIELGHHGGMDNGRLPATFDDFQRYGIDRHAIAPAIRELIALGFVEVTEHGRAGNADWRSPNRFRITYKQTKDAGPTHEWKRIQTAERARAKALKPGSRSPHDQAQPDQKIKAQWGKISTLVREPHTYCRCGNSPLQATVTNPHFYQYLGVGS
jgi:hypothetical protein